MYSRFSKLLGIIMYWLAWPMWLVYFKIWNRRSRVLVFADGKLLLAKTWIGNGSWGLPGGGAKLKETIEDSAIRELKEEVGITVQVKDLKHITTFKHKKNGHSFDASFYALELDKVPKIRLQKGEISDAIWVSSAEIRNENTGVDIVPVLKKYKGGVWYNSNS